MSGSLNQCQFIGNLGRDPETRTFSNGNKVCNLRIACSESWKDRDGNKKEKTEWVSVAVFQEGLIRVCEQYLRKGSKIYVSGKMATRKYQDQSGNDRYSTEIVLQGFGSQLIMLDSQGGGNQDSGGYGGQSGGGHQQPSHNIDDDEIPF